MSYKQVQFIAHCIYTGPKVSQWSNDETPIPEAQEYVGLPTPEADIQARVKLVEKAINLAYEETKKDPSNSADRLKIFMMPEFFFRGKDGAYQLKHIIGVERTWGEWISGGFLSSLSDTVKWWLGSYRPRVEQVGLVGQLQYLVKDPKWKDWIFVFGSIIGVSEPEPTQQNKNLRIPNTNEESATPGIEQDFVETYNLVLVQEGGFGEIKDAYKHGHILQKVFKAPGDFIKIKTLTGTGRVSEQVHHPLTINEYQLRKILRNLTAPPRNEKKGTSAPDVGKKIHEKSNVHNAPSWEELKKELIKIDQELIKGQRELDGSFNSVKSMSQTAKELIKNYAQGQNDKIKESIKELLERTDHKIRDTSSFIFKMKGFNFGLEICRDHFENLLSKSLKSSKTAPDPIQIHLIPSAGATISYGQPQSNVVTNGYVFNCDGYKFDSRVTQPNFQAYNEPEETIEKIKAAYQGSLEQALENEEIKKAYKSHSQVITVVNGKNNQGIERKNRLIIPPSNDVDYLKIFAAGAGSLHIYPPQPFPPNTYASLSLSIFPNSSFVGAMSNEPLLLNGMKVIFDQPVGVYPVNLESKEEARRNGT